MVHMFHVKFCPEVYYFADCLKLTYLAKRFNTNNLIIPTHLPVLGISREIRIVDCMYSPANVLPDQRANCDQVLVHPSQAAL